MIYCQSIIQNYLGRIYYAELKIKDTTESNTSDPTLIYSCQSGGKVSWALPFMTNVTISTSISQIFLSRVAIFHLRQPTVCLSHSLYSMPGLAPHMNVLFWERCDFYVSFSGMDMSGNVWNRPSGSSMVDMWISSSIMLSPSPKYSLTFWNMIIYSDTLHWSNIALNRDLVTELELSTVFDVITLFHKRTGASSQQWTLTPPATSVSSGTFICSNVETILSWPSSCLRTFWVSKNPPVLLFFLSKYREKGPEIKFS